MKKKYEKPKMEMVKPTCHAPLLSVSGWPQDYTAGISDELGGPEDFD